MRKILALAAASSMLLVAACDNEPEVVEADELGPDTTAVAETATDVGTWDTNADGMWQDAEYTAYGERGLGAWDTDSNGLLSQQEFDAGWTGTGFHDSGTIFTAWDDDGDGMLTDDEFFDDEEWTEWDTNTSGVLEENEFGSY